MKKLSIFLAFMLFHILAQMHLSDTVTDIINRHTVFGVPIRIGNQQTMEVTTNLNSNTKYYLMEMGDPTSSNLLES